MAEGSVIETPQSQQPPAAGIPYAEPTLNEVPRSTIPSGPGPEVEPRGVPIGTPETKGELRGVAYAPPKEPGEELGTVGPGSYTSEFVAPSVPISLAPEVLSKNGYKIITATSIDPTTGQGKFVVFDPELGRNVYMTEDQLKDIGLEAPRSVLRNWQIQSAAVAGDFDKQQELKQQFKLEDQAQQLSDAANMSLEAAKETIERWQANPESEEFLQMPQSQLDLLMGISPLGSAEAQQRIVRSYQDFQTKNFVAVGQGNSPTPDEVLIARLVNKFQVTPEEARQYVGNPDLAPSDVKEWLSQNPSYIDKATLEEIRKTDPEGADLLVKGGFSAYNTHLEGLRRAYASREVEVLARSKSIAPNDIKQLLLAGLDPQIVLATGIGEDKVEAAIASIKESVSKLAQRMDLPLTTVSFDPLTAVGAGVTLDEWTAALGKEAAKSWDEATKWTNSNGEQRFRMMIDPSSPFYQQDIPKGAVYAGKTDENGNPYYYTAEQYALMQEQKQTAETLKAWERKAPYGTSLSYENGKAVSKPSYIMAPDVLGALKAGAVTPQRLINLGYDEAYVSALVYYLQKGQISQTSDGLTQIDLMQILANNPPKVGEASISAEPSTISWKVDSVTRSRLITLGFKDSDINTTADALASMPVAYQKYVAQYGTNALQQAYKTGTLPYSSSGWNVPSLEHLLEDLQTFNYNVSTQLNNSSRSTVEKVLGGFGQSALMLGPSLLVEGSLTVAHPSRAPSVASEMAKGAWQSLGIVVSPQTATPVAYGSAVFNTALVLQPLLGPGVRAAEFGTTMLRPDYIPFRSLSEEAFTFRKMFTPKQISDMRAAGITEAQMEAAGGEIITQLAKGAKKAEITLGPVRVTVKNIPYQTDVGHALFNSTPDITLLDRGGSVPLFKDFFTTARAAVEPMSRSYLEGTRATRPGLIELRGDPTVLAEYTQAGKIFGEPPTLEPQQIFVGRSAQGGYGFRIDPIPGRAGRGVTDTAELGVIPIRRFTVSRVTGNPTGLKEVEIGGTGKGGLVVTPDIHAMSNFSSVFKAINRRFSEPILEGDPAVPETWHVRASTPNTGWTVTQAGDLLGDASSVSTYLRWRDVFNRLHDEAESLGVGRVERVLGNHELAILARDEIAGQPFTDAMRASLRPQMIDDILTGRVKAATSADGKIVTHAGVSLGVYPEFKGWTPERMAARFNENLVKAVRNNKWSGKDFAKGRVEKGHSLLRNEREQGGIYWLRPQEALAKQLDLGFEQIVGHNPGTGVREIWGKNFIEADVGVKFGEGIETYANTPFVRTERVPIQTTPLDVNALAPRLDVGTLTKLRLKAMRDTLADFVLGWDGRSYAIDMLKSNKQAVKALVKSLDDQIAQRKANGDSIGVKYLERQKSDLLSPTLHDYFYGGISFWRDIVMGRQNSMKMLSTEAPLDVVRTASLIEGVRNRITEMSNYDVNRLFGYNRQAVLDMLDTSRFGTGDEGGMRAVLASVVDIVDEGISRNLAPYLDGERVAQDYANRYQTELSGYYRGGALAPYVEGPGTSRLGSVMYGNVPTSTYTNMPPAPPYSAVPPPSAKYIVPPPDYVPPPPPPYTTTTPPPPSRVPPPPPPKTPPVLGSGGDEKQRIREAFRGATTWKQGFGWWAVKSPYRTIDDVHFFYKTPPPDAQVVEGGLRSAYRSIQALVGGDLPAPLVLKLGFQKVTISGPSSTPGKQGAITFENVVGTKTLPDIDIDLEEYGGSVKGTSAEKGLKFGSTFADAISYQPRNEAQANFIQKRIAELVTDMTPQQIASALQNAGYALSDEMTQSVLSHLPDIQRGSVVRLMTPVELPAESETEPDLVSETLADVKSAPKITPVTVQNVRKSSLLQESTGKSRLRPLAEEAPVAATKSVRGFPFV